MVPAWSADAEAINSAFGLRAMGLGDVNGDGYGDLAVGAPGFENGRGKAYVYHGGPQGLGDKPAWSRQGLRVGDRFADRVGQAGDVNGDGYADLYAAVPSWKDGPGRCEVFHGGPKGLSQEPDWAKDGSGYEREQFGDCTHPTGDVNGDGFDDLVVGAYQALSTSGRALLYLGGPRGLGASPVWQARGEAEGDQYAYALSSAGDLDGDGFGDVLVGAKFHDNSLELGLKPRALALSGKAYLYRGGPSGLSAAPQWVRRGQQAQAQLSVRGYGAGDLDGDGHPDLLLSAPGEDEGQGAVYLLKGPGLELLARISGRDLGVLDLGRASGPAGDVNGDGLDDVLVAGKLGDEGRAWVYFGAKAEGFKAPDIEIRPPSAKGGFAAWVAPAGDLDGDGLADLVLSAEIFSEKLALGGRVYVVYGRQVVDPAHPRTKNKSSKISVYLPK